MIEKLRTVRGLIWKYRYGILFLLVVRQLIVLVVPFIVVQSGGLAAIEYWLNVFGGIIGR